MTSRCKHDDTDFSVPLNRFSQDKCGKIHAASLEILERIGAVLHLEEAVQLLKKAGAQVYDDNVVRIPSHLVEKALATVPKKVVLSDRHERPAIHLGNHNCYYGPGSDCLNIIDHRDDKRRKPLVKDVSEGVILCDSLANIDFVMSMVLPSDVNQSMADRFQMEAMLNYTTKPIVFVSYDFSGCVDCVDMAEAVMGGAEALRKNPLVACYINVPSGLLHNEDSLRKLLFLAEKNIPSLYIPSSTEGVTSPITTAGAVALDYAGVLVGLVLSQLKREGAPVIIPGMSPGPLDMRTAVMPYCDPEQGIMQSMAKFYGLPMFSLGGASESKAVDQQAAAEASLSLLIETLTGSDLIHDLGYLESGLTFSFSHLLICSEIVNWIKAFTKDVKVNMETLALDVITEVGPEGNYLKTEHTLKHYKERWYPDLFERDTYDSWHGKGGKTLSERAGETASLILAEHKPELLPSKIKEKLQGFVQKAKTS
ncbi:MAG TPA: trimethylamine methyltransferase family protein [Candidatus Heimdallarchaeota archaeon]|nr:trimethylamine methyltransferase family protein [Candidatus Heimdallarchaeota archaeon]